MSTEILYNILHEQLVTMKTYIYLLGFLHIFVIPENDLMIDISLKEP